MHIKKQRIFVLWIIREIVIKRGSDVFPIALTDVCFVSLSPGVPRAAVNMAGGAHNHGALSTATAPTPVTEELRAIAVST